MRSLPWLSSLRGASDPAIPAASALSNILQYIAPGEGATAIASMATKPLAPANAAKA
jgi:hypothetical protein